MKRLSFAIMFALLTAALFAQDEPAKINNDEMNTLFGKGNKTTIGWFIGPAGGYTRFCSSDVALAGIQVGMVVNHNFTIGLAGYGVANSDHLVYPQFVDTTDVRLEGGYGGLLLEYTLFPKSVVHVTFPLIIGGGSMAYISNDETADWDDDDWDDDNWDCDHQTIDQDVFFVVEPGVRAEVNILKFMRFGAGVSYRYAPDLDMINTSSGFINNFTASASLKFGKF
jgi:hypothetical protein